MDVIYIVVCQPIFSSKIDKLLPIVSRDAGNCAKPQTTIGIAVERKHDVGRQSIFEGEIDELFTIISRYAVHCAEPHYAAWLTIDAIYPIPRQSVFGS